MASVEVGCVEKGPEKVGNESIGLVLKTFAVQGFVIIIVWEMYGYLGELADELQINADKILLFSFGSLTVVLFKGSDKLEIGFLTKPFQCIQLHKRKEYRDPEDYVPVEEDVCGTLTEETHAQSTSLEFEKKLNSLRFSNDGTTFGHEKSWFSRSEKRLEPQSEDILKRIVEERRKRINEVYRESPKRGLGGSYVGSELSSIFSNEFALKPFTKSLDALCSLRYAYALKTKKESVLEQKFPREHDENYGNGNNIAVGNQETGSKKLEDAGQYVEVKLLPPTQEPDAHTSGRETYLDETAEECHMPCTDGNETKTKKQSNQGIDSSSTNGTRHSEVVARNSPTGNGGMSSDSGDDGGDDHDEKKRWSSKQKCQQDDEIEEPVKDPEDTPTKLDDPQVGNNLEKSGHDDVPDEQLNVPEGDSRKENGYGDHGKAESVQSECIQAADNAQVVDCQKENWCKDHDKASDQADAVKAEVKDDGKDRLNEAEIVQENGDQAEDAQVADVQKDDCNYRFSEAEVVQEDGVQEDGGNEDVIDVTKDFQVDGVQQDDGTGDSEDTFGELKNGRSVNHGAVLPEETRSLPLMSKCKKITGTDYSWSMCSHQDCASSYQMVSHSQNCLLKVLGGCKECCTFRDELLLHSKSCHDDECALPKCADIRDYIFKNGIPDRNAWDYKLDKLFFSVSTTASLLTFGTEGSVTTDEVEDLIKKLKSERLGQASCPTVAWNSFHVDRVDRPPDEPDGLKNHHLRDNSVCSPVERTQIKETKVFTTEKVEQQIHVRGAFSAPPQVHTPSVPSPSQDQQSPTQELENVPHKPRRKLRKYKRPEKVKWLKHIEVTGISVNAGQYDEGFEWRCVQHLGGGASGRCYLCIDKNTDFLFAIKKVPRGKFDRCELDIWTSLSGQHESILTLYGAVQADDQYIYFMEYMEAGSIETILDGWEGDVFDEKSAIAILQPLAEGLDFMHSKGILHRDIKGANILLNALGTRVKIADFGDAFNLGTQEFTQNNTPKGTEAFMPPEVCRSEPYRFSADMWSLGCILYQMLTGQPPWQKYIHGSILYQVGTAVSPPDLPDWLTCSSDIRDVLYLMLTINPEERPTAAEVLRHRVFQTVEPVVLPRSISNNADNQRDEEEFSGLFSSYSTDYTGSSLEPVSANFLDTLAEITRERSEENTSVTQVDWETSSSENAVNVGTSSVACCEANHEEQTTSARDGNPSSEDGTTLADDALETQTIAVGVTECGQVSSGSQTIAVQSGVPARGSLENSAAGACGPCSLLTQEGAKNDVNQNVSFMRNNVASEVSSESNLSCDSSVPIPTQSITPVASIGEAVSLYRNQEYSELISLDIPVCNESVERSVRDEPRHSTSTSSAVEDEELQQLWAEQFLRSMSEEGHDISQHLNMMATAQPYGEEEDAFSDDSLESFVFQTEPQSPEDALPSPSAAYSMTDLTKVEVFSEDGELILTIRVRSTCSYLVLAEHLRHKIADLGSHFHNFTFSLMNGEIVDPQVELGFKTNQLKLLAANDDWKGWRMTKTGNLERRKY